MKRNVLTLDVLISKEIEYAIDSGEFAEEDRLPSERILAEKFGVQRGTVRSALQILVDREIVIPKARTGYFVAPRRIDFDLDAYNSRKVVIERMGKSTSVKLLTFDKIHVSHKMALKTGLAEDSQVYRIMRLRYAAGEPIGLERTHIRCDLAPNLSEEDVHNKSIYAALLRKHQIYIARCEGKVTAVYANGLESELLHLDVSKPVMRYEALVYDVQDRLIEYFDDIILKDKVQFITDESFNSRKNAVFR